MLNLLPDNFEKNTVKFLPFLVISILCLASISNVMGAPLVFGHRGYSAIAPENTLPAIAACEPYAAGTEIDIYETADGEYILMHDTTVDRTTDGTGAVSSLTFDYIRSLDASYNFPSYSPVQVPTLLEAVNTAMDNNLKLCIEIKQADPADMISILTPYSDYIELHSFNESLLQSISDLGGDFTYVLIGSGDLDAKAASLQPCIDKVSWGYGGVTQTGIDALHALNKEVYAWTVNSSSVALGLSDMGIDAIITDDPATINFALNYEPENVSYPCQLKDSLLAHWSFDDGLTNSASQVAADSVNGYDADFNGNLTTPDAWKSGTDAKIGGAIELDGVDDGSNPIIGEKINAPKRGLTISTWIKLDKLPSQLDSTYGSIYDSAEDAYVLYLDRGAQELRMKVTASAAVRLGIPESMLDTSGWHQVTGVYDGGAGTAQLYLDGEMVDITANEESPLFGWLGSQSAAIGNSVVNESNNAFDGKLDEMSIWGRALGQAEISYLYNQGQGRAMPEQNVYVGAPTPVVKYDFEGNLTNTGSGGSSYNANLQNGAGTTVFAEGVEGDQALEVANDHVNTGGDYIDTHYTLTETGSISFWCKPTEYYNYNSIFDTSADANDWEMWIYSTGVARFRIEGDSYVSAQLGDAGEWYHLAVTWAREGDEVLLNIFLDGRLQDLDRGAWIDPGETLYLLGGNDGNMGANMTLDDFRIYDSLLTSDEIMAIYQQKEQPAIAGDANGDGCVDGSDVTILAANWQVGVNDGETATWEMGDFNGDGKVDGSDVTILAGNWQYGITSSAATVPEPSVAVLLLLTTLLGWFTRKHRVTNPR